MKKSTAKLISEFNKNTNEVVRVQLTTYENTNLLDIRVWALRQDGEYVPTKKGITLRVEQVGDLKDAIEKAAHELEKGKFT